MAAYGRSLFLKPRSRTYLKGSQVLHTLPRSCSPRKPFLNALKVIKLSVVVFQIMTQNRRKLIEWTSNSVLFAIVVLSWTYAIFAGRYGPVMPSSFCSWANFSCFSPIKGGFQAVSELAGLVGIPDGAPEHCLRRCRCGRPERNQR